MLEKNKGHIVNITSLAGSFPVSNLTDYCASKFGATGFSHSLALELYKILEWLVFSHTQQALDLFGIQRHGKYSIICNIDDMPQSTFKHSLFKREGEGEVQLKAL